MKNRWDFGPRRTYGTYGLTEEEIARTMLVRDQKRRRKARIWMTVFLYRDWMKPFAVGFLLGYVLSAMR